MKTKLSNRILALALALMMIVGILPLQALAASTSDTTVNNENIIENGGSVNSNISSVIDGAELVGFPNTFRGVTDSSELEKAIADGIDAICLEADFNIDRTFYINEDTIVYCEKEVTLTRDPAFGGDMFVVGQDSENNLSAEPVTFSIGGFGGDASGGLKIDGNSENMSAEVVGTVVFVCPGATADLYDNLYITNCKKVGNDRATNAIYELTNTANIGGAVAILSKSSFMNIHGGVYSDNAVNTTGASIYGGAFYNYATMTVYGGVFENNSAARAGAFYNYRTLTIYSATVSNNTASAAGGAIYLPASSAAKLYLGGGEYSGENAVVFRNNTAKTYGGAIYSSGRVTSQDSLFDGNSAENGGAIYVSGSYAALSATATDFTSNKAS